MRIEPKDAPLGATVYGIDLSHPLGEADCRIIEQELGRYGVLSFPKQTLTLRQQRDFSEKFGKLETNVANTAQDSEFPQIMILSNMVENGKPLGLNDAGQGWHTDMSYSRTIAFSNVLFAIRIPHRNGQPLGDTEFCNMHAAYEGLPEAFRQELDGMTVTHDFNKFWEMMRSRDGSLRQPLTEEQRRRKPPVSHPLFLTHPITRRKVLYANPGYSMRINELPQARSDKILAFLFQHQMQDKYRYRHRWSVGDVLMWDNIGTIHNAVADYRPDEPRYIRRCQVMADRYYPELF